jgi:glucose-1-phosphate thymidylyltransferase
MIYLFEDTCTSQLYPISQTNLCGDIRIGKYSLYEYITNVFGEEVFLLSKRKILVDWYSKKKPKIKIINDIVDDNEHIFINARILPSKEDINYIFKNIKKTNSISNSNMLLAFKGKYKGFLQILKENSDVQKNTCRCVDFAFEIPDYSKELLEEHVKIDLKKYKEYKKNVFVGKKVVICDSVIFNTDKGNIVIEDRVKIHSFAVIKGPAWIGKDTVINENCILRDGCSIGNVCKIGGEIEASIIFDYSNKQHYGFLGHSVICSWVNIGAGTSNSDLKNTYGSIKIDFQKQKIDTKKTFFGCVIGNYSKLAINTSIYTGKTIGINTHVLGNVLENIGDFILYQKGIGKENQNYYLDSAFVTQKRMFERRGLIQTQEDKALLKFLYDTKNSLINLKSTLV